MITRHLFDASVADLVETGVADVSDRGHPVLDEGDREDAGHAFPLRAGGRQAMNLVVGDGNRFADALADRSGLALEPLAQHAQGDVGSLSAGGLPANAVDDDEQAARLVNVEAVLIDVTLKAGVSGAGSGDRGEPRHMSRVQLRPVLNSHICAATT